MSIGRVGLSDDNLQCALQGLAAGIFQTFRYWLTLRYIISGLNPVNNTALWEVKQTMNSQDVDGESLQAVKSLRSKFEQLAVDTSNHVRRPSATSTTTSGSGPSSPRARGHSGSLIDIFAPQAHLRTSSSSSELKASSKRPPPPPPPRIAKPPPSPQSSRSSSPSRSPQLRILNEDSEEEILQGVTALKSKL